ncbi:hypothetical protein H7J77_05920 [Mycolicibacillus parakoreensis]|uniref:Uncharacterized protein n=1 Tax=Mycolicibacillus parakoreensis TaxID=1069221 RepID=A0ABY3U0R9_9MYCO|nr:hypothetical protein [Mycolicibacillus parakoreensis]MCV7315074.1 hypothetical protein [Mycolicibacillus parakoreensis]ULN53572.1 hypothetical protein MIU77_04365 [Mycolicibacillus parakoreensis]
MRRFGARTRIDTTRGDRNTFDGKTTAVGKNTETDGDLVNTIVFPNPLPADTGKGCDRAVDSTRRHR